MDSWDETFLQKKDDLEKPKKIPEFKLDSSLSHVLEPSDGLVQKKKVEVPSLNFDMSSQSESQEEKKKLKSFILDSECQTKKESIDDNNVQRGRVRDFDEFRDLLKDLKLSLNLSVFSAFEDNTNQKIDDIEFLLERYSKLDQKILTLLDNKGDASFIDNKPENGLLKMITGKKSQSLNLGQNQKSSYLSRLEALSKESKLNHYQIELIKLQKNPVGLDSFIFKLKKEQEHREKRFRNLKEFLV